MEGWEKGRMGGRVVGGIEGREMGKEGSVAGLLCSSKLTRRIQKGKTPKGVERSSLQYPL
jgi:hypothetical protein